LTVSGPDGSDTHTEENFVYNIIGLVYADNTFQDKPHYYSRSVGSPITFGKTICYTGDIKIPENELKYSRMFYGSCNTAQYYVGAFHRGIVFATTGDYKAHIAVNYLEDYLKEVRDEDILKHVNSLQPIFEYFNFDLKPSSMRK